MTTGESRRDVLKKGLGTGLAAATGALRAAGAGTEADRPNILLIMTEDQGAQLGCARINTFLQFGSMTLNLSV